MAYRVEEVAAALSISKRTVLRRIDDGSLASVKKFGVRLVLADSLAAFLTQKSG
jgi:excisionase family DNA binding protein